ncbi:MAG TPA: hypothetical protein VFY14_00880 [Streptomyces sp.]|nr:hypothetical protein [Streptomyces sp.]
MAQALIFFFALTLTPLVALVLLIWGLNGTSRLLDLFADRKSSQSPQGIGPRGHTALTHCPDPLP